MAEPCATCGRQSEARLQCGCGLYHCGACFDVHECPRPIELRPYQQELRDRVHEAIAAGNRRVLLVAPTGAGKRFLAVWWSAKATAQGKKSLVVTNRRTLVQQMFDELKRFAVPYGVVMGDVPTRGDAPVQVASLQTLATRYLFDKYGMPSGVGLPDGDLVLIDEGHLEAKRYKELLKHYPDSVVVALTATPVGRNGRSLVGKLYDCLVMGAGNAQLLADGFLCPVDVYAPEEPDMEGVKIERGEYVQDEMIKRVTDVTVFANVFKEWSPHRERPTICFAPGVEFSHWLAKKFTERGFPFAHIDASTPLKLRKKVFEQVAAGEVRGISSVGTLREGLDIPCLSCAIDLQPTLQLRDFVQKVGRIRRSFAGKERAVFLDFAGSYWRHGHPDDDFPWDKLTGKMTIGALVGKLRQQGKLKEPLLCAKCNVVRRHGPVCPACGHRSGMITVRRIRMLDGKLKTTTKKNKAPEERKRDWQQKNWTSALFRAAYSHRTVAQAKFFYRERTGEFPPDGLKDMFPPDSLEWQRRVVDAIPWIGAAIAKKSQKAAK